MTRRERRLDDDTRDIELGAALRGAAEALTVEATRAAGRSGVYASRTRRVTRLALTRALPVAAALAMAAASSITGVGLSRKAAVESASLELARLLLPVEGAWLDGALAPYFDDGDELMAFLLYLWAADGASAVTDD